MGRLVEQPIPYLFNGVSRQPSVVRLPSQVEEAENLSMSVVTGGFSKRASIRHLSNISTVALSGNVVVHGIDRSANEKYIVILTNNDLVVYDALTGAQKTVNFPDGKSYLSAAITGNTQFALTSIADYTLITNRTVITELDTATTGTITGVVEKFSDLPSTVVTGAIYKVTGEATELDDYYVIGNAAANAWVETVNPNGQNSFKSTKMPHVLVKETSGDFTFKKATWKSRAVGDSTLVPAPTFIGKSVQDITFYKDRLVFLADENVIFGQAGDYFNFWPQKATEVLDSDPIDVGNTTSTVALLKWAVPFRQSLFTTSDNVQFEVSQQERLTPGTASMDPSTFYKTSPNCKPVAIGNSLYFPSSDGNYGIVFEYFYDDSTITNTAADATKHVLGYIPNNIIQLAVDPPSQTLFALSAEDRDSIYAYNYYMKGEERVQSAWHRWNVGLDGVIQGILCMDSKLYIIVKRGASGFIETIKVSGESKDPYLPCEIKLDRRVTKTSGTYDAVNDWTTWTLPYAHLNDVIAVFGDGGLAGDLVPITYPASTTIRANGNHATGTIYIGLRYTSLGELSKIHYRNQDQSSVITGRLQLKTITLSYKDSGYFKVIVTPEFRDPIEYEFTGRIVGSGNNLVGSLAIEEEGRFRFPVYSKADTVKIEIQSDSYLPFTINNAAWTGFFNEISRQE